MNFRQRESRAQNVIRSLGIILVALTIIAIILFNYGNISENDISNEYHILDSKGTVETVQNIGEYKFDGMKKDDWVEITCVIDNPFDYNSMLVFSSEFCYVEVFLENEKIYENTSSIKQAKYIEQTSYVPLGGKCKGKNLKIKYTACDRTRFDNSGFLCMEGIEGHNRYLKNNIFIIGGSLVFVLGGIIILIFEVFYHQSNINHKRIIINSAYCCVSGVWILTSINFFEYFYIGDDKIYYLKYFAIYLSNALFLYYLAETFHEHKKESKLLKYMACIQCVLLVIATVLHITSIMSYSTSYELFAIVNLVNIAYMAYVLRKKIFELIKKRKIEFIFCILFAGVIVFGVLSNMIDTSYGVYVDSILPIAILLLNLLLFCNHTYEIIRFYVSAAEHNSLILMAYTDSLTEIANRNKCEEKFEEVNNYEEGKFGIILFDINGLKHVNDTFGHTSGDELICAFANVLKELFKEEGMFCGRLGGDEFIVILNENIIDRIEELMGNMLSYTEHINSTDAHKFSIKYSYGVSICDRGANDDIWDKIAQADANMYVMKK